MANTAELLERVRRVLVEEVAPALTLDGAGIEVVDLSDGVLRVRLLGVCGGCPSTILAVVLGLEEELRRRFPDIAHLEAIP